MRHTLAVLMSVSFAVGAWSDSAAQTASITLTTPNAGYPEPLSLIAGLRELADGTVMVSDGIDNVVVRIDFATGKVDTVGRTGKGPGEYESPDALFPFPQDKTLLMDLGNARLTVYGPRGTPGTSWSIVRGQPRPGQMVMVIPRGVDSRGMMYFQPSGASPGGARPDSGQIVRWDPERDAFDTLASVKLPEVKVSSSGAANNRSVRMSMIPFSGQDAWAVAPDGRIAVVSAADYHVEWIQPDGKRVKGRSVSVRQVPIRSAEKEEWQAQRSNGLQMGVSNNNGQISVSLSRGRRMGLGGPPGPDVEWPANKPAFSPSAVWVAPDGVLWVERSTRAGAPRTYDRFGPDGNLISQVILPRARTIVGLGRGAVYARRLDDSDLQYLERYPVP